MPCGCVLFAYMGLSIWDGFPRTIHFEITDWRNKSWGLHDVDRRTVNCETAISGDESRMNRCDYASFRYWVIPNGSGSGRGFYLRSTDVAYAIDDSNRIAYGGKCTCSWTPERLKTGDTDCTQTAAERLPDGKRIGTGSVAGYTVVRYRDVDDYGNVNELALAPILSCDVMEEVRSSTATLGIPSAQWRYIVTSYTLGEPDSRVFRLPAGYRIK